MRFFHCFAFLIWVVSAGAQHPDVVLTTGHSDQVNAMEVSPDGHFLASASNDKLIKIWDLATGMEFRTISGTDGRVEQLAFAPDNVHLAGTSFNEELLVWNVLTGQLVYDGHAGNGKGLAFLNLKGKQVLLFTTATGHLKILDLESSTERLLTDEYTFAFEVDPIKKSVFSLDHLGNLRVWNLETETLEVTNKLFDEPVFPFSNGDISPDGRYIAYGFGDDHLRVIDTETGKFSFESKKLDSKIVTLAFDRSRPVLYLAQHNGKIISFNYKQGKISREDDFTALGFSTQCITGHPQGEVLLLANNDLITVYDFKRKRILRKLIGRVGRVFNMAYDPNGRYLITSTEKTEPGTPFIIQVWDLKLNRVTREINAFFPCIFAPDGASFFAMTYQLKLGKFNVQTGELEQAYEADYEALQAIAVSKDGRYLAGAGYQNTIKIWDVATGKRKINLNGHSAGILSLDFHPEQPWIVSGSLDQTSRVWNYESGKEIKQFTDQTISVEAVKFNPNGKQLATGAWDQTIFLRNTATWETEHILKGHNNVIHTLDFSGDGEVLVSGAGNNSVREADNSILCWNARTGEQICRLAVHKSEVKKVICDPNDQRIFSASIDGEIKLCDYEKCELIATYRGVNNKEFIIYTPDNYYIASRQAVKGIAFRLNGELIPFEQFDVYLNRPDIVAKRIGKSPPELIRAYRYLYLKRLRKLNLEEGSLKLDYKLPKVKNETAVDLITTANFVTIWIKAWDEEYNLKQINVYVNGVPIYGAEGLPVKGDIKSYRKQIKIPLVKGENKILISCLNANGVESLYENLEIIRNAEPEKHNLYIAAIGVSNYQDERFKLKYPAKDANDMLAKFGESKTLYKNIHTRLLLNEDVTKEQLADLANFFSNCSHEDMAIVFVAGHGVLNADYDYFFGTHDMDFDHPEKRGWSYEQISYLLSKIKAYQKLLIMDTCHSGELDKTEVEEGPHAEVEEGDVKFRNAGAGVRVKEGIGFDNSLKISENLFSDIRQGSGATVVSSAGGAEYAMESDQWSNGLFTYVFLEGLTGGKANTNRDQYIQLSEIRAYVNSKVELLSNGKQIPSAREENINRDYIIFDN